MFDHESRTSLGRKSSGIKLFSSEKISLNVEEVKSREAVEPIGADIQNPLLQLLEKFPHVGKRIIGFWGSEQLNEYMMGLTLMDRPERAGFSDDVMGYILGVWDYVKEIEPSDLNQSAWLNDPRLSKHFKKDEIEKTTGMRFGSPITGAEAAAMDMAKLQLGN